MNKSWKYGWYQDDITPEDKEAEKEDGEEDNDFISFRLEMPAGLRNLTLDIKFHEQSFLKTKVVAIKHTYQVYKGVLTEWDILIKLDFNNG